MICSEPQAHPARTAGPMSVACNGLSARAKRVRAYREELQSTLLEASVDGLSQIRCDFAGRHNYPVASLGSVDQLRPPTQDHGQHDTWNQSQDQDHQAHPLDFGPPHVPHKPHVRTQKHDHDQKLPRLGSAI